MIEFEIDTTRLEQKLLAASRSIQSSIVQGVSRGTEQLEKQIDDFMFVPLAMVTNVISKARKRRRRLASN